MRLLGYKRYLVAASFVEILSMYSVERPCVPFVYICGAGPGDLSLLTIKTYTLITKIADVVVYDRLIADEILSLIPKETESIYAGKACKKHHMTQDEINQLLVDQAKMGKVVVRLKGGDPFIFGRGGEEMLHLMANHIPFEIVPGVNAADGSCAYQHIPLTHRSVASSVTFLTGHQQKGQSVDINYASFSSKDQTLVIFMGLAHLEEIAKNLIQHGRDENTPVAAIMDGTTKNQRICKSTLQHIYRDVVKSDFKSPTIIVVGEVVNLVSDV